jgi:phosphinothricin acetyltransferase
MTARIRLARPGDAPGCLDIYRPIVLETVTSFETTVPSPEEFAGRIEYTLRTHPWLVAEDPTGRIKGYAYGTVHRSRAAYRWSAEVSAYVAECARRAGVGRALYRRLFECLRAQGFASAFAGITLPNPASVAFHEALGFQPIGTFPRIGFKFGRWHDTGWWSLRLLDTDSPAEPRPLSACRDEIEQLLESFVD